MVDRDPAPLDEQGKRLVFIVVRAVDGRGRFYVPKITADAVFEPAKDPRCLLSFEEPGRVCVNPGRESIERVIERQRATVDLADEDEAEQAFLAAEDRYMVGRFTAVDKHRRAWRLDLPARALMHLFGPASGSRQSVAGVNVYVLGFRDRMEIWSATYRDEWHQSVREAGD